MPGHVTRQPATKLGEQFRGTLQIGCGTEQVEIRSLHGPTHIVGLEPCGEILRHGADTDHGATDGPEPVDERGVETGPIGIDGDEAPPDAVDVVEPAAAELALREQLARECGGRRR